MSKPPDPILDNPLYKPFIPGKETFHPGEANRMMGKIGHSGFLGLEYSAHGEDWVELFMDWREDLVADTESGIIASSAVITLMDNACSLSVWTKLGRFRPQVTMDLRLDYLRPSPRDTRIYGKASCYHMTKNVGFVRGIAHNGDIDDPIAFVSGTFLRVKTTNMLRT